MEGRGGEGTGGDRRGGEGTGGDRRGGEGRGGEGTGGEGRGGKGRGGKGRGGKIKAFRIHNIHFKDKSFTKYMYTTDRLSGLHVSARLQGGALWNGRGKSQGNPQPSCDPRTALEDDGIPYLT